MPKEYPPQPGSSTGNSATTGNSDQNERSASTGVGDDWRGTSADWRVGSYRWRCVASPEEVEAYDREERRASERRASAREATRRELAKNLNDPRNYPEVGLSRQPYFFPDVKMRVVFDGIEDAIKDAILRAEYVVGCIAWLTSFPLLDVLATKRGVSIVVQKEDFLRPDDPDTVDWKERLREKYKSIRGICRYGDDDEPSTLCDTIISGMEGADSVVEAIRCFGTRSSKNQDRRSPLMHHKFAVLFGEDPRRPYAVITGSWNWTKNATKSIENVLIIHDECVARAYFHEFVQILAGSEPLDWTSECLSPEWRMGT